MSKKDDGSKGKNLKDMKGVSTFNGYDMNMINEPDLPAISEDD